VVDFSFDDTRELMEFLDDLVGFFCYSFSDEVEFIAGGSMDEGVIGLYEGIDFLFEDEVLVVLS